MKCLSLWQPWAALMDIGVKTNETRSWATSYRGSIAIHAARTWNGELYDLSCTASFFAALRAARRVTRCSGSRRKPCPFPLGCVLCVVDVLGCVAITADNAPPGPERDFGDYTPGRFMWRTANLRRLREPLPWRGAQGLFEIPDAVILPLLEVPS